MPAAGTIVLATYVLKAIAVVLLARIGVTDFRIQKIYNTQLLALLVVALGLQVLAFTRAGDLQPVAIAAAMAAGIFVILIVFWLLGKIGAGDVKLLGIAPLLVGSGGSAVFVVALLVFSVMIYILMKFPVMLPERWFRGYVQSLAASGRVPFGVPISAAAIVALLLGSPV